MKKVPLSYKVLNFIMYEKNGLIHSNSIPKKENKIRVSVA